jgi:5-methylcytosine-specific restriction enzyme subunit McrC
MSMATSEAGIPVRNIYVLLAYAWGFLDLADLQDCGATTADTPRDLLAYLLVDTAHRLLRRGAHKEYLVFEEDLRDLRGRIDVPRTASRALRAAGRVACDVEELHHDAPPNRMLKAGLGLILRCRDVHASLTTRARALYAMLSDVGDPGLTEALLRGVRIPRAVPLYGLVRDLCGVLLRHALPDASGTGLALRDFTRDDLEMAHLFEAFVRGFLRWEAKRWKVDRQEVRWVTIADDDSLRLLPRMITDVSMNAPGRRVILETKFVRQPFRMVGDEEERVKLRSEHLYQLFAYAMNTHAAHRSLRLECRLVYAGVGRGVRAAFSWGAVPVEVHTIDLAAEWGALREQMQGLIPE